MEHKFKVGDKVKVHYLTGNRIGYIQERKSELRYDIRYDEGCIGHDIEENRIVKYNGNQDMEIKVGDKVRVSKDAPRIYTPDWVDEMFNLVLKVTKVEDGNAMVVFAERTSYKTVLTVIPTKYLIKVDAEADANEKLQEEYARFMSGHTRISLADRIEREHIQTRMRVLSQEDFLKDFDPWEHKITPERPTYEVTVDNVTINWQRYEADLAKEIAVKLSKPNENKPGYVAEYAVSVAKTVVENLKKK